MNADQGLPSRYIFEKKEGFFDHNSSGPSTATTHAYMQKSDVVYNRKRYDNSTQLYRDYFGRDIDALVNSIKKYKQTHGAHNKGEGYLADLLKEK